MIQLIIEIVDGEEMLELNDDIKINSMLSRGSVQVKKRTKKKRHKRYRLKLYLDKANTRRLGDDDRVDVIIDTEEVE
jgi:hypothetical protein